MKYYNASLLLIVTVLIFTSCSEDNLGNISSKQEYIEQLSGLSDELRKKRLEKDAGFLTTLLDSEVKDIQIYYSFSFGSGGSSFDENLDTAKHFTLVPSETLQFEFAQLNEVIASQNYAIPHSTFDIYDLHEFPNLIGRNIDYEIKNVFRNNKAISLDDLGLHKADSLLVGASYSYITSFDILEIDRTAEQAIRYEESELEIREISDQSIELRVPAHLNILNYQAISRNGGVLMNTKGHSIFPILGLSLPIETQLREMITLLTTAAQSNDKETCIAELEKIQDDNFTYIPSLVDFGKDFKKIDAMDGNDKSKDILKVIKEYKTKYADILGARFYSMELNFPQPYTKILLYVATENQTISRDVVAICEKEDTNQAYYVFLDRNTKKYGVMDSVANIVIPPTYNHLFLDKELYFIESVGDGNIVSYHLNEQNKKLEKFPEGINFHRVLGNGFAVFVDKEGYESVFADNKKQIIPYLYDNFELNGKILIARGSKRGQSFYDFYTLEGKKIDIPKVKDFHLKSGNPNIIVYSAHRKYGLLDENGVLSIPMQYEMLEFLDTDLLKYAVDKQIRYRFSSYGIINTKGQEITPPQFSSINEYYKGYALAYANRNYILIDTNGNTHTVFQTQMPVYYEYDKYKDEEPYYETADGQKYTYDGKPIKN